MQHRYDMISVTPEGIFCEAGNFHIDPWRPVANALITHGHADHARWGMGKYLCHHHTVPILQSRIGTDIRVQGVEYRQPITINGVGVSFHPAGHIIGSAQIRLQHKGRVVVISGDYKLQDDGLSEPFEPVKCHEFITESTFGLPIYRWLPIAVLHQQLREWIAYNRSIGKTSVFIGYSLGKAQRLLQALDGCGPIYVHSAIARLNEAYARAGVRLPAYQPADLSADTRHLDQGIVILPPALADSNAIRKIPNRATAICSGWMQVRGARRWRSADAGFAISDHADWQGLLTAVRETGAEKVYVTHGQTSIFARYLNEQGIMARELHTEFGDEEEPTPTSDTPQRL